MQNSYTQRKVIKIHNYQIIFITTWYRGYGTDSQFVIRAVCENKLLMEKLLPDSEVTVYREQLHIRSFFRNLSLEKFENHIKKSPLASAWCQHCGKDTLDGNVSVWNAVFCMRCKEAGIVNTYSDEQAQLHIHAALQAHEP